MRFLISLGIIGLFVALTACSPTTTQPASQSTPATAQSSFNHKPLTELLTAHVDKDGMVNYSALQTERAKLNQYLDTLKTAQPASLPNDAERLAFWINAYNATTLAAVLDDVVGKHKSVKDIEQEFFKRKTHTVAGEQLTLDQIEQKGRDLKDPRIHFAVNCASFSCPKLQPMAFTGDVLEVQLQKAASEFLGDSGRGLNYSPSTNSVSLSPIFKWYAADFTNTNAVVARVKAEASGEELLDVALRYVPSDVAQFIREKKPTVKYFEYNWQLNAQVPNATNSPSPK